MAKNIERILNKLQGFCDEKALDCASDFAQHESWLLGTFKMNALQKLGRPKVELACPTSAKKQKTGEAPMEPAPVEAEPADVQMDSAEEPTPMEVRFSPRSTLSRVSAAADTDLVLQSDPAPVAAPDPGAAAKLAAAMAAAMGTDKAAETSTGQAAQEAVAQPDTVAASRTPVAANTKPTKNALISPDSPRDKNPSVSASAHHSQPKPPSNPVQATSERQVVSTAHRTLSATEQLSRLRQKLAGFKSQTPSQPANPGESRLHSVDKSASAAPAIVTTISCTTESNEAASTSTADTSQKRDVDQVEHTNSVPKKTKLGGSPQSSTGVAASPVPTTDVVQPVDTNSGAATKVHSQCAAIEQEKKAPSMAVENKLAMAAARRQQMEIDQAAERTKENAPAASGSSPGTDQSKKRCVKSAVH